MKAKIVNFLLIVIMILGFSLVTALPVIAQPTEVWVATTGDDKQPKPGTGQGALS